MALATFDVPSDRLELRRYQQEGVAYLVRYKRTILADETGVGKTPQALVAARQLTTGRILVIAPKPAAQVWVDLAEEWLSETPEIYQGMSRAYRTLDEASIVITNYHLMKEVLQRHPHWSCIIFDEAHKLRNRKRETLFKTAKKFSGPHVFFLTGTPIFSSAADLWPLLNILYPAVFRSYWDFANQWAELKNNPWSREPFVEGVKRPKALKRYLNENGLMLRRMKTDVLPELPAKTRSRWPLEMVPKQKTDYKRLAKEMLLELTAPGREGELLAVPSKLALTTRLRQLLVSPKLLGLDYEGAAIEALKETLGDSRDAAVVFTPFAQALPIIDDALGKAGREVRTIRGGMSQAALADAVRWFRNYRGPNEPVLLSSLLMGTSWTAVRASQAFFLGYDWSPANNFQAEDRIARFGQTRATNIYYFVHKGTIDEHLMDILNKKQTVARLVLDMERFVLP